MVSSAISPSWVFASLREMRVAIARRLFAASVAAYCLGLLGWLFWPAFRASFIGKIVGIPPFSIYVLEHFGIPGLTDRDNCDWMWCKPTILGIIVTTAVWLGATW